MTKKEAEKIFKRYDLKRVKEVYEQDGIPDWPARQQAWNDFTDYLHKSGAITRRQYDSWTHPAITGGPRRRKRR
jgi:hypothetical protein